ncbi:type II secretion system protein M [Maribrevibacterium harenarium]|uniref:Type II secretion system protein M n=1 Tax=Maribrevibacterium harenarium TaxID=2589817 RepID=A0A501WQD2_9GAMM|nr:type II secretion system protein GspM [Maribrevibacterium harenarium]TPE50294.1 type II secretion system protein M [Maribrevibacterium harenarium]
MKQWLANQFRQSPSLYALWLAFHRRSTREQILLLVAGFSLLLLAGFYGIWQPQQQAYQQAQQRLATAQENYQLLISKRHLLAGNAQSSGWQSVDREANELRNIVSRTSRQVGLAAERISVEGDSRLQLWANNVPFATVAKWLELLAQERVGIYSLQIERVADAQVSLRITLD